MDKKTDMDEWEQISTSRLLLRKPRAIDAQSIFERYANDVDVTRYLGWPRHLSLEDTRGFLAFSDQIWARWPSGPYLMESLRDGKLLGSAGFDFLEDGRATVGYVLARDAWGMGYATEALTKLTEIAEQLGIRELLAYCHPLNESSTHVLDKCGFGRRSLLQGQFALPNFSSERQDVWEYAKSLT